MGDHTAGGLFVKIATALDSRRKEGETALQILDEAFERSEIGYGRDAEFDDATSPGHTFYDLINEAFNDGTLYEEIEDAMDAWYDDVYGGFKKRYQLS